MFRVLSSEFKVGRGFGSWGFFDGHTGIGDGDTPSFPFGLWGFFVPVRGDNGIDRSFITRDFNRGWGKENGTIPFYRRFFDRINKN